MLEVWKDKTLEPMISTIHDATVVHTGRKDRETNLEIKKPYAFVQHNKLMKGIDKADQYLSYYSVRRETVKWSKNVVLCLLNCALFNAFFVSICLSGLVTAVAVFRNPNIIPFCLTTDLLLNVLFSWLLVHLPSTFFLGVLFFFFALVSTP